MHVEDVRADVAVQADELERGQAEDPAGGLRRGAAREGEAELLVLLTGLDVLVGVRLHSRRHPHLDTLACPGALGDGGQAHQLVEAVDHDAPDARLDRPHQLGHALVVAVERQPLHREAGPQRHSQLAAGADVEGQALLGHPPGDRGAQERLARVVDVAVGSPFRPERVAPRPAAAAEVVLVQDVRGGAELRREVADVDAPEAQDAVLAAGRGDRPDGGLQVAAQPQHGGHIRSGAETPSRRRPFSRTVRVARHSSSRGARSSDAGSSPFGSTWQSSQNRCAGLATFSSR